MTKLRFAVLPLLLLSACGSGSESYEDPGNYAESEDSAADPEEDGAGGHIPVGEKHKGAQIAYSYDLAFQGAPDTIETLQQKHAALCRKQGEGTCRLLSQSLSDWEHGSTEGELSLEVAADQALSFIDRMNEMAEKADADLASRTVSGEDLSKQIIDVEARLSSRRLLRDRLMKLLERHDGSVEELVQAERAVAEVNGEIEQAEARLADMTGRVRFSDLHISYSTDSSALGFLQPVREAVQDFVGVIGGTVGVLIRIVAVLIPLALFLIVITFALRKAGVTRFGPRRWRFWHKSDD